MLPRDIHGHLTALVAVPAAALRAHICGASKLLRRECTRALGCADQGMPIVIWLPLLPGQPPLSMCTCVPRERL